MTNDARTPGSARLSLCATLDNSRLVGGEASGFGCLCVRRRTTMGARIAVGFSCLALAALVDYVVLGLLIGGAR